MPRPAAGAGLAGNPCHVVISGCSGGGKSSLVAELARRGHRVVEEPGRRIVAEELRGSGRALPWLDPAAFARRAVRLSLADIAGLRGHQGIVFFDRGLIDAAAALERATGERAERFARRHLFYPTVFLAPPWREIFAADSERRHGFEQARAEFDHLSEVYTKLGYRILLLPKASVRSRAAFVLAGLGLAGSAQPA